MKYVIWLYFLCDFTLHLVRWHVYVISLPLPYVIYNTKMLLNKRKMRIMCLCNRNNRKRTHSHFHRVRCLNPTWWKLHLSLRSKHGLCIIKFVILILQKKKVIRTMKVVTPQVTPVVITVVIIIFTVSQIKLVTSITTSIAFNQGSLVYLILTFSTPICKS